jgi:hypothetical protein
MPTGSLHSLSVEIDSTEQNYYDSCRLDARLGELEAEIDTADGPTKAILQTSAELWLGSQGLNLESGGDDENGPISRQDTAGESRPPALRGSGMPPKSG